MGHSSQKVPMAATLHIRLSEDEKTKLEGMAKRMDLSLSEAGRMLIRYAKVEERPILTATITWEAE